MTAAAIASIVAGLLLTLMFWGPAVNRQAQRRALDALRELQEATDAKWATVPLRWMLRASVALLMVGVFGVIMGVLMLFGIGVDR